MRQLLALETRVFKKSRYTVGLKHHVFIRLFFFFCSGDGTNEEVGGTGRSGGRECSCKLLFPRRAAAPHLREAADSGVSGQLQETGLRGKGPRESD